MPRSKTIAVGMFFEGMPVSEIASTLAMTEAEVKREIFKYWKEMH